MYTTTPGFWGTGDGTWGFTRVRQALTPQVSYNSSKTTVFLRRRQSKCDNIFESIKFIPRVGANPHSWLAKSITLLSLLNDGYSLNTKSTQGSPYTGLQCGC